MNYLQYWPGLVVVLVGVAYALWPKSTSTPAQVPAPAPSVPPVKDKFEQEVDKLPKEVIVAQKPEDVKPEVKVDSSVLDKPNIAATLAHESDMHKAAAVQKQGEVDNHKRVADHLDKAVKELN